MMYFRHKTVSVLTYCFLASVALSPTVQAKTTFLPDFEEEPMEFGCEEAGGGEDYCLCQRSTNPKYHLALSQPQCPRPKIFDLTCPHSNDWITECYCPASYNQVCTSPYRGVGLICDGKYEECCDTRCREGSTSGCSYPYVTDYTSSTGCGETCYVCRYGNDCNTNCSAGEEASYSGGYNDFNGSACVSCSTPPPPEPECIPYSDESGCNCYSCSDGCGGTRQCCGSCSTPSPDPKPTPDPEPTPAPEPEPEEPSCTDTCSSKGYQSSQPSGQTCSTTTVCGSTCYYNCKDNHTHSYSCPSGSQASSCGSGYKQTTVSMKCSGCSSTYGVCYKCEKCIQTDCGPHEACGGPGYQVPYSGYSGCPTGRFASCRAQNSDCSYTDTYYFCCQG